MKQGKKSTKDRWREYLANKAKLRVGDVVPVYMDVNGVSERVEGVVVELFPTGSASKVRLSDGRVLELEAPAPPA